MQDLPPLRLEVTEHQAVAVRCPACQAVRRGVFPETVRAPAQYGPQVQALAVHLHHEQVVPQQRTHEALTDLFDCPLSEGTVAPACERAAAGEGPISQWTGRELADELMWRGILPQLSARHAGRLLLGATSNRTASATG